MLTRCYLFPKVGNISSSTRGSKAKPVSGHRDANMTLPGLLNPLRGSAHVPLSPTESI